MARILLNNTARSQNRKLVLNLTKFDGGVNKLLEEARIRINEAKEATNLIQVQDGLWKPRWGTDYYGETLGANPDGAIEYVVGANTRELIAIVGGVLKYSTDDGATWTTQSGATFTAGVQCYFLQINQYLYIANGTDNLARYTSDGTTRSLTTYTALSAPAWAGTPLARGAGLSAGVYNLYYIITALNEIGETIGSTEQTITVNKERDSWSAADEYITLDWNAVTGADRYQVYFSDEAGYEVLLASTTDTTYQDDGSAEPNPYVEVPNDNTTSAPKFKSMVVSGNRIWATNDPDNPYKVYFSGVGQFLGTFSDFYGGGWINLEKGGREFTQAVVHYQSGQGEGVATVLCSTPEGRGAVWQINITTATVGTTSFSVPSASKIVGSFGTDAQLSVVQTDNDIFFFNRRGIYSLGPEKNYYGILRTTELSSRIRPYIRGLIGSAINKVCAYYFDAKVFFSVPTSGTNNNRTIYYDMERRNWVVDWSIGAKQFFQYTDASGNTHLLYVPTTGDQLIEISEDIAGDLGEAFSTSYMSGRISLEKLWKDFVKVNKAFIRLGSPRGAINFEILGSAKNTPFSSVASATITPTYSMTGMGFDLMGDVLMGDTEGTPSFFSDSSDKRYLKIRKKLADIQFRLTTNSVDADYTLLGIIIEGNKLAVKPPSSWKL
jgi:hypothetical protein